MCLALACTGGYCILHAVTPASSAAAAAAAAAGDGAGSGGDVGDGGGGRVLNSAGVDSSRPEHGFQRGTQSQGSCPQRLAVPKKSAKKWQQLRAKRVADANQRAATAARFDPTSADLSRSADAAAASAALAIRAWAHLRATCGWQSVTSTERPAASGGDSRSHNSVASLSDKQEIALAGMFRAAYKTCEARVDPELIADAVQPYTLDKFESRADLCCRALLEARARFITPEGAPPPCQVPAALFPECPQVMKMAARQLVEELTERKRAAAIEVREWRSTQYSIEWQS